MLGPTQNFSHLMAMASECEHESVEVPTATVDLPADDNICAHVRAIAFESGLLIRGEGLPRCSPGSVFYIGGNGVKLALLSVYALAEPPEILHAAAAMIGDIRKRYGAGRVWFALSPVHVVSGGPHYPAETINGRLHMRLRSSFYHEAVSLPDPPPPPPS
jgi:hypothetical protein